MLNFFLILILFFNYFSGENRLEKIIHINEYTSNCFSNKNKFNIYFSKILKKYFGLNFNKKNNDNFKSKLIEKYQILNETLSDSKKFIFDNSIDFLIDESKSLLNNINEKDFSDLIVLNFLTTSFLPNKFSSFLNNYLKENNFYEEKLVFFENTFSSFYFLKDYIMSLKDSFLEKESNKFFEKISKNKKFIHYNSISIFIDEKGLKKKKTIESFDKLSNEYKKEFFIKNLKSNFLSFLDEKIFEKNFNFLLKKEILSTLYFVARIGNQENLSILKIDKNLKNLILDLGCYSRFIIDKLNKIFNENKINWKEKKYLYLSENTIKKFFQTIIIFSSLDKNFFSNFSKIIQ